MPKLGNSVESVILLGWHVSVGNPVRQGQPLCEVETDKAAMDIESAHDGVLLARYFEAGDEVNVLQAIGVVGAPHESIDFFQQPDSPSLTPRGGGRGAGLDSPSLTLRGGGRGAGLDSPSPTTGDRQDEAHVTPISPRARNLAARKGIDATGIQGSGPGGRIIERDIQAALEREVKASPVAKAMLDSGDYQIAPGREPRRRITKSDLEPKERAVKAIPLAGARKVIAERMLHSTQSTAQLTLHRTADATALLALRKRMKTSDADLGLRGVSINHLLLFAVSRALMAFPALNATFKDEVIYQHDDVHLGMAVDTPRALLVPVIRRANARSLRDLAAEARRLADAAVDGKLTTDDMAGGSFTVTNLGALGIDSFTPILNPPQVAILGIGSVNLKPVETDGEVTFAPHIALSLTLNHQIVDGAPAARFLAHLAANIADIDLLLVT